MVEIKSHAVKTFSAIVISTLKIMSFPFSVYDENKELSLTKCTLTR